MIIGKFEKIVDAERPAEKPVARDEVGMPLPSWKSPAVPGQQPVYN